MEFEKLSKEQLIAELEKARRENTRLKKVRKELTRAEGFLAEERFKFKEYFDNLPLLAYNIDFNGKIRDVNRVAVERLGYKSRMELIGKPLIRTIYTRASQKKAKKLLY
jgi:PAS domain-containing protein